MHFPDFFIFDIAFILPFHLLQLTFNNMKRIPLNDNLTLSLNSKSYQNNCSLCKVSLSFVSYFISK